MVTYPTRISSRAYGVWRPACRSIMDLISAGSSDGISIFLVVTTWGWTTKSVLNRLRLMPAQTVRIVCGRFSSVTSRISRLTISISEEGLPVLIWAILKISSLKLTAIYSLSFLSIFNILHANILFCHYSNQKHRLCSFFVDLGGRRPVKPAQRWLRREASGNRDFGS